MKTTAICAAAVAAAGALGAGVTARAQTADDYNRAAQAIRVCSSSAAPMIPECAQVRARFGLPSMSTQAALTGALGGAPAPAAPVLPSWGGGKAGAVAGLLGMAMNAAATSQAPAAQAAPVPQANMNLGGLNPGALNGGNAAAPPAATPPNATANTALGLLGAAIGRR